MTTAKTRARLLTVEETAKRLNVSRATAYRMVYDGRLPTLQLGGRGSALRVDEVELERWLYGLAASRAADRSSEAAVEPRGHGGEQMEAA
jgi:excisionase family DNA binding protein